jgi:hypothetical protein
MATNVRMSFRFKRYTDHQLAPLAAAVIKGMTGNKAFPNPPADPAAVQAALDDYNAALAANLTGGTTATAAKNNKRDVLIGLLDKLAHYVQTHCENDREVLLSSGFETIAARTASNSSTDKPSILGVDSGNTTQLVVRAGKVPRARCYELRSAAVASDGATGAWQPIGFFTNSRSMLVSGLIPGTHYAFQVRAMGTAGFSDWSDPVVHVCW